MQRDPASPRRPPMGQYNGPRGPPPPRPYFQGGAPDPRYQHQQYADPVSPAHYAESVVSEAESEQWPLPSRHSAQPHPRSNSPRKKSRQPRDHYQYSSNQSRQYYRSRPPPGQYQQGPPRHPQPSGQWNGDGYGAPYSGYGPSYSHRPPPPRSAQPMGQPFPYAPPALYNQSRNPRYPPGAPAPSKGDPTDYNLDSQPITGEPIPDANWPLNLDGVNNSLLAPAAHDSARVKIPSYYFGQQDGADAHHSVATSIDENHDSPMESQLGSEQGDVRDEKRNTSSPEPVAPIRQASLGKKTKPKLTTVTTADRSGSLDNGVDESRAQKGLPNEPQHSTDLEGALDALPGAWISEGPTPDEHRDHDRASEHGSEVALATSAANAALERDCTDDEEEKAISSPRRSSNLLGPAPVFTGFAPFDFESESPVNARDFPFKSTETSRHSEEFPLQSVETREQEDRDLPLSPVTDAAPHEASHDDHDEPVSPIEPEDFLSPIEAHMDRTETRRSRPADIDIQAIRDAESRGSMTSLPDLIRRATKLRTNLDRGKTASRLGMNYFLNASDTDVDVEKYRANARRSGASISDMLTAFPSPGGTNEARKSLGNFSSMLRLSRIPSTDPLAGETEKPPSRKYCGMPLWLCLVLLVLMILLIAAAVVIPVVLIVIPKQHHTSSPTQATPTAHLTALQQCEASLSCQNSGINVVTENDPCSCLCVNGYTGKTCTEQSSSGCTTMFISNSASKATVGEDVQSLISSAEQSYNIPLNPTSLLGLFSSADLTCDAENQLVNFSASKRARSASLDTPTPTLNQRRKTKIRAPVPSSSSSSPSSSASGGAQDFAGAAVLYIFQETGEHTSATEAQESFQNFFNGRQTAKHDRVQAPNAFNISLGNGFSCNLPQKRLVWVLANGTVVGN